MDDERDIDEEEATLWDEVTRDDTRYKDVKPGKKKRAPSKEQNSLHFEASYLTQKRSKEQRRALADITVGDLRDVDGNTADKLKRGKYPSNAQLDLHGHTKQEAAAIFREFIKKQIARKSRCVLVVTGKGYRSADGVGVLRHALPGWLNETDIRPHIIAACHAQEKDGGAGAFYILLRRPKG